ncbi:MAG TPA: glycoside hydrolase family 2 protein [Clostridiales bacterium]|nr:glycoside hydrolase family 2 protein [Clostridiales bacterium]
MKCIDFNEKWRFRRLDQEIIEQKAAQEPIKQELIKQKLQNQELKGQEVNLPHDAMLSESRSEANPGGGNICYFDGGDYLYSKAFFVPEDYRDKAVIFEFEGVYRNAEIFINQEKAAYRPYGYTNFYVGADRFLKYGEENIIQVIAHNLDQPNSRWYTGSGIYRPVHMYVADKEHLLLNGVKINTLSIEPAVISVEVGTSAAGEVKAEIFDGSRLVAAMAAGTKGKTTMKLEVPQAKLWSPEQPNLYQCRITFGTDTVEETFGIRTLGWNDKEGFSINGKRVILRGACIHHDNGLLGACCYPEAEERKVRLLKENGYNAIRSAHNPCSKALLNACDRLGMLVMDEYVDVWYIHKTEYDYAGYLADWWREDLKDMVEKDYNHPCVVMYSTGNEVSETAQERGIRFTGQMTDYLHQMDPSRPVTCGVNIFFNFLSSIGFGVYSDEKAKKNAQKVVKKGEELRKGKKKHKPVGSEFYNTLAGLLGDKTMKIGATFYGCDVKTRDAYANMDIAGYNYGILRYRHDLKKYPGRLILGSETFCKDAYTFWELAKKNPRIIGDFVWAGMDYLGEVGIGAWVYEDYAPKAAPREGWLTAGSGRIDITGKPLGEAAYTKTAFGLTDRPTIAVRPVYGKGKHSPSAWKMTDAMESWSWEGREGEKAVIEVYARAYGAALFLNGKCIGRKKFRKDCAVHFQTKYEPGELTAVAYDAEGNEMSRSSLRTAGKETLISIIPETEAVKKKGLCYVRLQYTDREGILKPTQRNRLHVAVSGGALLGLGNACSYNPEGYLKETTDTYYGEALAVIKAGNAGSVAIQVTDGKYSNSIKIPIVEN